MWRAECSIFIICFPFRVSWIRELCLSPGWSINPLKLAKLKWEGHRSTDSHLCDGTLRAVLTYFSCCGTHCLFWMTLLPTLAWTLLFHYFCHGSWCFPNPKQVQPSSTRMLPMGYRRLSRSWAGFLLQARHPSAVQAVSIHHGLCHHTSWLKWGPVHQSPLEHRA